MSALPTPHHSAPLGAVSIFRVVSAAEGALGAVSAWQRARATRRTLAALSDAQLDDIGLTRGQIAVLSESLARR